MQRRHLLKTTILATAFAVAGLGAAWAENADKLKIGFVGVTSGPAAAWGTSNVRSMETLAAWLNEKGGVEDRRQDLRHRDRHLRRPEGPQARHRRHGEDGAGGHPLRRRPERR